ncbi:MAG: hypothetical protein M3Q80_00610 [bacterium]|nr:hypothetical protein [bacterium]
MPRRVQDIIPNKHRSIRDIPVERNNIDAPIEAPLEKELKPRSRTVERKTPLKEKPTLEEFSSIHRIDDMKDIKTRDEIREPREIEAPTKHFSVTPPKSPRKKKSFKFLYLLMGIIILVAGVAYVASVYFSQATFTIVPVQVPVTVNANYVAQASAGKDALVYELVSVNGSASSTVAATEGQQTSTPAKGSVILYNEYSKDAQQLIAGTRLADDSGRIYRLNSSVVIPGYTSSGATVTPGSITTTVTADQPGPKYNISRSDSISDLKIVAYKGTSRYTSMYARLATDISGGFTGMRKSVAPATLTAATAEIKAQITNSLMGQIRGTIPDGYLMYNNGYVVSFSEPNIGGGDAKTAVVSMQGTLHGILFKKNDLVTRIAGQQKIAEFEGFAFDSKGLEDLEFSIANQKDFSPEKKNSLIIKLTGDMELVGSVPEEALKAKLAGLPLSETASVLRQYKPIIKIDESSAQITPPWSKVPNDTERISIEVLTK